MGGASSGKSTLFNALSPSEGKTKVEAADQLFSTLDPVTRRIRLPSGGQLLLTDTVGFIQKLSTTVVAAFRATLEELAESDLLLHVMDITHPKAPEQTEVVESTLSELGLGDRPRLLVINKMDLLAEGNGASVPTTMPVGDGRPGVLVSAAKGWNLDLLLGEIENRLIAVDRPLTVAGTAGGD